MTVNKISKTVIEHPKDISAALTSLAKNQCLVKKVKENASIDWTIKENVRAKLKVMVKRLLRQFGYPPDMQALATDTVLEQAERIAGELVGE